MKFSLLTCSWSNNTGASYKKTAPLHKCANMGIRHSDAVTQTQREQNSNKQGKCEY